MVYFEMITGPMFSGKSEELLKRIRRLDIAGKVIVCFKPSIDTRYTPNKICSHSGGTYPVTCVENSSSIQRALKDSYLYDLDYVVIDEICFFDDGIVQVVEECLDNKVSVIGAGLDKDFRGGVFGAMPALLCLADYVTKLDAVCVKCGLDATCTQRLENGVIAKKISESIIVGNNTPTKGVSYEARCRNCWVRPE